jgi:hypothetical protein
MMHDVLEDTDVTAEEMRRVFGDAITDLVLEVTDVSRPSDGKRAVRKEKDKDHLAKSSPGGAISRNGTAGRERADTTSNALMPFSTGGAEQGRGYRR